jgi:Fe-Mn family superoxide dismutase
MTFVARNFDSLIGTEGLSEKLLKDHFTLYQGYVKNTNKLLENTADLLRQGQSDTPAYAEQTRRFGWEFNGMRLHELYFGGLKRGGARPDPASGLQKAVASEFGSPAEWEKAFRAVGAMRGIGWVVLTLDPVSGKLFNAWINEHDGGHLAGGAPLLVMDVFEHAYFADYGLKRADYIETFIKAIDWSVVSERFSGAKTNSDF